MAELLSGNYTTDPKNIYGYNSQTGYNPYIQQQAVNNLYNQYTQPTQTQSTQPQSTQTQSTQPQSTQTQSTQPQSTQAQPTQTGTIYRLPTSTTQSPTTNTYANPADVAAYNKANEYYVKNDYYYPENRQGGREFNPYPSDLDRAIIASSDYLNRQNQYSPTNSYMTQSGDVVKGGFYQDANGKVWFRNVSNSPSTGQMNVSVGVGQDVYPSWTSPEIINYAKLKNLNEILNMYGGIQGATGGDQAQIDLINNLMKQWGSTDVAPTTDAERINQVNALGAKTSAQTNSYIAPFTETSGKIINPFTKNEILNRPKIVSDYTGFGHYYDPVTGKMNTDRPKNIFWVENLTPEQKLELANVYDPTTDSYVINYFEGPRAGTTERIKANPNDYHGFYSPVEDVTYLTFTGGPFKGQQMQYGGKWVDRNEYDAFEGYDANGMRMYFPDDYRYTGDPARTIALANLLEQMKKNIAEANRR